MSPEHDSEACFLRNILSWRVKAFSFFLFFCMLSLQLKSFWVGTLSSCTLCERELSHALKELCPGRAFTDLHCLLQTIHGLSGSRPWDKMGKAYWLYLAWLEKVTVFIELLNLDSAKKTGAFASTTRKFCQWVYGVGCQGTEKSQKCVAPCNKNDLMVTNIRA